MKKGIVIAVLAISMVSCGMLQNGSQSSTQQSAAATQQAAGTSAVSAGQGAGGALLNLYNQYKADGNKYDYKNMQNVLNTVTLLTNCEGLKTNYKDTEYLKDFGKGMIASSLGLVTQNNVETVTNSLVEMVKNSETVQTTAAQAQNTANTAADYANTAAQYAGALGSILSMFGK